MSYSKAEQSYHTIMLVEDDQRLADLVVEYMQNHGFTMLHILRGDDAVKEIINKQPDLVILDLMLPGIDGFEVCRQVRSQYDRAIMMLTAKDEDVDQIVGLEIGADDYVTKPVEPRLLLARVKSLLRRSQNATVKADGGAKTLPVSIGGVLIDVSVRKVTIQHQEIVLTGSEFDLFLYLATHIGTILSRDDLYEAVSGIEYDGVDRAMDIRISRLRKLIDQHPEAKIKIKTIRGKGYLLVEAEEPYRA